jgi:hypothetical protein
MRKKGMAGRTRTWKETWGGARDVTISEMAVLKAVLILASATLALATAVIEVEERMGHELWSAGSLAVEIPDGVEALTELEDARLKRPELLAPVVEPPPVVPVLLPDANWRTEPRIRRPPLLLPSPQGALAAVPRLEVPPAYYLVDMCTGYPR